MATEMAVYSEGPQYEGLIKELMGAFGNQLGGLKFDQKIFAALLICEETIRKLGAIRGINLTLPADGMHAARFVQEEFLSKLRSHTLTQEEAVVILVKLLRLMVGSVADDIEHTPRAH